MLTIETWLEGIGLKQPIEDCPAWPPDLFALAGTLIRRSGAYLRVFERPGVPDLDIVSKGAVWRKQIDEVAKERTTVSELQAVRVDDVLAGWRILIEAKETPISEINQSRELAETIIRLALLADEASVGIGIDWDLSKEGNSGSGSFLSVAETALISNKMQSFCMEVPRDVLCVLGKQHTPQRGATFRSLSHHLALYQPHEIEARWVNPISKTIEQGPAREVLNLLLLPWPTRVETDAFREVPAPGARGEGSAAGYFRYQPNECDSPERFSEKLSRALATAQKQAGIIDAIVFPELALTKQQYEIADDGFPVT